MLSHVRLAKTDGYRVRCLGPTAQPPPTTCQHAVLTRRATFNIFMLQILSSACTQPASDEKLASQPNVLLNCNFYCNSATSQTSLS